MKQTENVKSMQDLFNHMKSEIYEAVFMSLIGSEEDVRVLNPSTVSIHNHDSYLESSCITKYLATGSEVNIYESIADKGETLIGSVPSTTKNLSRLVELAFKKTKARVEKEISQGKFDKSISGSFLLEDMKDDWNFYKNLDEDFDLVDADPSSMM